MNIERSRVGITSGNLTASWTLQPCEKRRECLSFRSSTGRVNSSRGRVSLLIVRLPSRQTSRSSWTNAALRVHDNYCTFASVDDFQRGYFYIIVRHGLRKSTSALFPRGPLALDIVNTGRTLPDAIKRGGFARILDRAISSFSQTG